MLFGGPPACTSNAAVPIKTAVLTAKAARRRTIESHQCVEPSLAEARTTVKEEDNLTREAGYNDRKERPLGTKRHPH